MLSRVADLAYWTARYLERAENAARIVDVNAQLVLDLQAQHSDERQFWEPLVYVSGGEALYHSLYNGDVSERSVVEYMLFDRRNPSSFVSCISSARENARCIRDQISGEVWEELNSFYLKLKDEDFSRFAGLGSGDYLSGLKNRIQLFYGVADSMIPRTEMWWFFELGRFLERADNTSRILDVKYYMMLPDAEDVGSALDMVQWASVLRSCSAFEAFRKSRRGQLNLERVIDYLVRDFNFPRSIAYSIRQARQALECVTSTADHLRRNEPDLLLTALERELCETDMAGVIARGVHEYLDGLQMKIGNVHASVQRTFIHYATESAFVLP